MVQVTNVLSTQKRGQHLFFLGVSQSMAVDPQLVAVFVPV